MKIKIQGKEIEVNEGDEITCEYQT